MNRLRPSKLAVPIRPQLIWGKLLLICALLAPLVAPLTASTALAQGAVPPACLDDNGMAHTPTVVGAWVLILNFNHPSSTSETRGCLASRTGSGPNQISYAIQSCSLVHNKAGAAVGGGSADFNGQFWIECPGLPKVPTDPPGGSTYDYFYVSGKAAYSVTSSTQTLMAHPDVDVTSSVDASWHLTLTSRYGMTSFTNTDGVHSVAGQIVHVESMVLNKNGAHYIEQQKLQPTATVPAFSFNAGQGIRIGNQGEKWSLYELIIDPGPRPHCCFDP
ncbi:MAG: hypothetical protein R2911_14115 [Caldilineaceae bacterium]